MPGMRKALAGALIVLAGTASQARAQNPLTPDPPREAIQPGMLVNTPTGSQCTGNFIFDGTGAQAGRHYLGIAAHCVEDLVGKPVKDAFGAVIGTVALSVWPYDDYSEDYAFIELDPAVYARVDPALAGHPAIPTGTVPPGAGAPGDRLQLSGWGFATEHKTVTREQRVSFLKSHNERFWFAWAVVSNTDSGGPVVHLPTGGALGSVSNFCVPLPLDHAEGFEPGCTAFGPSVAGLLADAASRGFNAEVRAAAEGAPPPPAPPTATPTPTAQPATTPDPATSSPAPGRSCPARTALRRARKQLKSARGAHAKRSTRATARRVKRARRAVRRHERAVRRCG